MPHDQDHGELPSLEGPSVLPPVLALEDEVEQGPVKEWTGRLLAVLRRTAARSRSVDFTEDLKKITVPVLVMHGDDDQVVPYADSGPLSARLVQNGTLKTYHGFPHGMPTTQAETINADLLEFIKA